MIEDLYTTKTHIFPMFPYVEHQLPKFNKKGMTSQPHPAAMTPSLPAPAQLDQDHLHDYRPRNGNYKDMTLLLG
jgi:hypothetical protein